MLPIPWLPRGVNELLVYYDWVGFPGGGERWVWDGRRGERQGRLGVVSLFGYFVDGFIRMCYGVGNAFSNEGCG